MGYALEAPSSHYLFVRVTRLAFGVLNPGTTCAPSCEYCGARLCRLAYRHAPTLPAASAGTPGDQPAQTASVSREGGVEMVADLAEHRPARWGDDPTKADGPICLSHCLQAADHPAIRKHAVQRPHGFCLGQAIPSRIKCRIGNVLGRQRAVMVAPSEPLDFTAAKRARPVVKQFHSPRHNTRSSRNDRRRYLTHTLIEL